MKNSELVKASSIILIMAFIIGCNSKSDDTILSLEEERQRNMAIVNSSPTVEQHEQPMMNGTSSYSQELTNGLPKFVLACSYGGGDYGYRIASDGSSIYFASLRDESNISATKKSFDLNITNRRFEFSMKSGYDDGSEEVIIYRDTLNVITRKFVSKSIFPPDGYLEGYFKCNLVDEIETAQFLKAAYDNTFELTRRKKQEYENRPNKI